MKFLTMISSQLVQNYSTYHNIILDIRIDSANHIITSISHNIIANIAWASQT